MRAYIVLMIVLTWPGCTRTHVPVTPPINPEASGAALRKVMTVAAVGDRDAKRRLLFAGRGELASMYSVSKSHDVVISFDDGVQKLGGSISVRARILGPTPTEIPVENYTVVNEKELKEERKLLLADDIDFFRDGPHEELIKHVSQLQRAATAYRALLVSTVVAGLQVLYSVQDVESWRKGSSLPLKLPVQNLSPEVVNAAVASIRRAVSTEALSRLDALNSAIDQVQRDIDTLFLASEQSLQLTDEDLRSVRDNVLSLMSDLTDRRSRLEDKMSADSASLDACASKSAGYAVQKEVIATDEKGAEVKLPAGEYFSVDSSKRTPKIVSPPIFEGLTIDLTAQIKNIELIDVTKQDIRCYERILPSVVDQLGRQLRVVEELEQDLRPQKAHDQAVLARIEETKTTIRTGIEKRLLREVRDARVRMSTIDLRHGDRVEIIVRVTRPGTTLRADDARVTVDVEERIVIRAVEDGVTFTTGPQFALIKRFSDVRVGTATEVPSNFKPAAGVVFTARYRTLCGGLDWVIPSVGLSAHVADFDPSTSLELGIGPSVGLLDEHIHAGVGWNLAVGDHRQYWWISLDFLRTSETFAGLFGGGK